MTSAGPIVDRRYLFVPPEEKAEVQALGARWDEDSKRWYIVADDAPADFSRWLPVDGTGADCDDFNIASDEAYVASASVHCWRCGARIEVICIHCESGTVSGDDLTRFTVSDVWNIDEALASQLRGWPTYHRPDDPGSDPDCFANHCARCGALQDELDLHSEPDAPFFDIPAVSPGMIRLIPLSGTIRLSGDEHFSID